MEFKTISDIENPLFNRREIEGEIHTEVSPSRQEVAKLLSDKFSVPVENIKIRTIMGKFGSQVFIINTNIYKSKEERNKVEIIKKKDAIFEQKFAEEQNSKEKPVEVKEEVDNQPEEVKEENSE
ncbi:MAG: hypothetical protein KJ721_00410 [Nanoarchaeota archaeon]|nr:hypothetical protein [Nanoarchaeota archaeon]